MASCGGGVLWVSGGYGGGFMWVSSRMRVWLHVGVGFCG